MRTRHENGEGARRCQLRSCVPCRHARVQVGRGPTETAERTLGGKPSGGTRRVLLSEYSVMLCMASQSLVGSSVRVVSFTRSDRVVLLDEPVRRRYTETRSISKRRRMNPQSWVYFVRLWKEKTNKAHYKRSVHRRWSFDFTYCFFTKNKKPLRCTVYGTRAIQDAVVSASEIIMWCDVGQVSEVLRQSFSPHIFFFFFLSKIVPGLCSFAFNVPIRPAKRALREHDTTATGWQCVVLCENPSPASFLG